MNENHQLFKKIIINRKKTVNTNMKNADKKLKTNKKYQKFVAKQG